MNDEKIPPAKQESPDQQTVYSKTYTNPDELRTIPTGRLTSGLPYQQPISEKIVRRLVLEWDDRLLTPLIVNYRNGKYYVIAGQHRAANTRRKAAERCPASLPRV